MPPSVNVFVRKTIYDKRPIIAVKKRHTFKNTVISTSFRKILFLGRTVAGSQHDYTLLKDEWPPQKPWFRSIRVSLDLGYLGITKDYSHAQNISLPHKKPRKSKANPSPELTESQKNENRFFAKKRVVVEHAIGGMKCFYSLSIKLRNHINTFADDLIGLAAGLWNLKISFRSAT